MKKIFYSALAALTISIFAASCGDSNSWKLTVDYQTADTALANAPFLLEASNPAGDWYVLDTIGVKSNSFTIRRQAPEFPEIYRLRIGESNYAYFPVDSIDNLNLKWTIGAPSIVNISGTDDAIKFSKIDSLIRVYVSANQTPESLQTLKAALTELVLEDPSSLSAYYIVNKRVDNTPIFNPGVRKDLGVIGAVANAYSEKKPNDPRTLYLRQLWFNNKKSTTPGDTILAPEIGIIDVNLTDEKGKNVSLADVASKNKVVVLNFIDYNDENSQALNMQLRKLSNAYKSSGLEIYQIGFDSNEFNWRMAAGNLPWVTVFNGASEQNLINYNVGSLPAIFIIKNGSIQKRLSSLAELEGAVASSL